MKVTCAECKTVGKGIPNKDNPKVFSFKCEKCGLFCGEDAPVMKVEYIRVDEFGNELDEFGNIVDAHNP